MAIEKIFDKTKSASANESAVNEKFNELSQQGGGGGITLDDLKATSGGYGNAVLGGPIDIANTPTRFLEDVNTLRMIKDMQDNLVNISGDYGHEPCILIDNGYAYISYMYEPDYYTIKVDENTTTYHALEPGESPPAGASSRTKATSELQGVGLSRVRLAKVDLSTMSIVGEQVFIAKQNDTVTYGGVTKTLWSAGSPNMVILNGVLRIWFVAWFTDTNSYSGYGGKEAAVCYRDYTISNGNLGDIGMCYFSKDNGTYPITLTDFRAHCENAGDVVQAHCQYAKINNKYYIAITNGTSGKNGFIFTTEDFINYAFWLKPTIPSLETNGNLGLQYEISLYPWIDAWNRCCLYMAFRTTPSKKYVLIAKIYTGITYANNTFSEDSDDRYAAGTINDNYYGWVKIPANSTRNVFFSPAASSDILATRTQRCLFVNCDNVAQAYAKREYTDIICIGSPNSFESDVFRIAQCLRMTYPSIVYNNGYYLAAYQALTTGSQPHVLLSRFRPFAATFDKVVSAMNKMLDIFEPK